MSGVRVKGLREIVRSLERMGVEVADLKAAFNRIGNVVVAEAVSLAPTQSGALANSIRASKTKNKSEVRAGSAKVPYAGVINYGGYNNIEGVHFLDGAEKNKRGEVIQEMKSDLNRLIQSLGLN